MATTPKPAATPATPKKKKRRPLSAAATAKRIASDSKRLVKLNEQAAAKAKAAKEKAGKKEVKK